MKHVLQRVVLITGLLLTAMRTAASPEVDRMSDIEISEYAVQMSSVLEKIQRHQLCEPHDTYCVRAELARYGVSYDDKKSVQKRLVLLKGSVY